MISCLLSSSVHALLLPATRPEITTNHPATSRLRTPVMKGQESFPQSISEDQLARIRVEAVWKEIEATAVWLNCPTLSVEEGIFMIGIMRSLILHKFAISYSTPASLSLLVVVDAFESFESLADCRALSKALR